MLTEHIRLPNIWERFQLPAVLAVTEFWGSHCDCRERVFNGFLNSYLHIYEVLYL